jgi:hypothetical protein
LLVVAGVIGGKQRMTIALLWLSIMASCAGFASFLVGLGVLVV